MSRDFLRNLDGRTTVAQYTYDLGGSVLEMPGDGTTPLFRRASAASLVGTPVGTVDFNRDGQIPRVAGGSPSATFDDSADSVDFAVPAGDGLQMSGGGTWVGIVTLGIVSVQTLCHKSTSSSTTLVDGYWLFVRSSGQIVFRTDNSTSTYTEISTGPGMMALGERAVISATLDLSGNAKIYKNGDDVRTQAGILLPENVSSDMSIGAYLGGGFQCDGSLELVAMIPGVVLTQPQIADIAAMCGNLG